MTSIGEKLLEARKAKGLTQTQAAVACKIDPNTFRDYERGVRPPTLKNIPALARVLGLSETWLIQQSMTGARADVADDASEFPQQLSKAIDRSKKLRAITPEVEQALRAMRNDPTVIVDLDQAVDDARRRLERKLGPVEPMKKTRAKKR